MKRGPKTLSECIEDLREWFASGRTGNKIFFKAPHANTADSFAEITIKRREMNDEQQAAFDLVFRVFEFEKAELFRNESGTPDRIKLTKG